MNLTILNLYGIAMTRLVLCTLITILKTTLAASSELSTQYSVLVTETKDDTSTSVPGSELARYTASSAIQCAFRCQRHQNCKVIDYNVASGLCRLGEPNLKVGSETSLRMKKMDSAIESLRSIDEEVFLSCRDVIEKRRSRGNGVYKIRTGNTITKTYCHIDDLQACGGGGWTLAMKFNGSKQELPYNASHWTQTAQLSTENGLDLSDTLVVLPTYWATPLTQICVGAKQAGHDIKWLKLSLKTNSSSLMNVITGSDKLPFQALSIDDWSATFAPGKNIAYPTSQGVSLEIADIKVRLGIAWNDISGANGFMGIGCYDSWIYHGYRYVSCGYALSDFSTTHAIASFCYVLVQ